MPREATQTTLCTGNLDLKAVLFYHRSTDCKHIFFSCSWLKLLIWDNDVYTAPELSNLRWEMWLLAWLPSIAIRCGKLLFILCDILTNIHVWGMQNYRSRVHDLYGNPVILLYRTMDPDHHDMLDLQFSIILIAAFYHPI